MSHNWQVCKSFPFQLCTKAPSCLILPSLFLNSSPDHLQFISRSPGCHALLRCVVLRETYDNASWLASSHSNYGTSVIVMGSTSVQEGDRPSTTWAFAFFPSCVSVCFQRPKCPGVDNSSVFLKNLIKMYKLFSFSWKVLVENVQPLDDDARFIWATSDSIRQQHLQ